jgi:hypothetical protein
MERSHMARWNPGGTTSKHAVVVAREVAPTILLHIARVRVLRWLRERLQRLSVR